MMLAAEHPEATEEELAALEAELAAG